jgi:hypothetical protein
MGQDGTHLRDCRSSDGCLGIVPYNVRASSRAGAGRSDTRVLVLVFVWVSVCVFMRLLVRVIVQDDHLHGN